jgi:hypothetical protein
MFSFIQAAVNQVMGTIMEQINFTEEILSQIQGFGPDLRSVWQGVDGDKFGEEINSRLIPEVKASVGSMGGMHVGIAKASEVVLAADQKARSLVAQIEDEFDKIC